MQTVFRALAEYMPPGVKWTKPDDGYTLWLELEKNYLDKNHLQQFLARHGVIASPGEYYYAKLHPRKYIRISIATLNEDEINTGIKRLSHALPEL